MSSDWMDIARYDTLVEAELAGGRLESADIPFFIDQHDAVGIFGPGHSGASTRGITLKVPPDFAEDARAELDLGPPLASEPEADAEPDVQPDSDE